MFLDEPPRSDGQQRAYAADRADNGYVDNLTRIWSWRPDVLDGFTALRGQLQQDWTLTPTDRAVLVAATASARGDSYCSLAWGGILADLAGDEAAAAVLRDELDDLEPRAATLARWARQVVLDPNALTAVDVDALRSVGLDDRAVFEATVFVALRLAFATVNDALGAQPDRQLADRTPERVRAAVTYGRPAATDPST